MSRNRAVLAHTPIIGQTGVNQYKGGFRGPVLSFPDTALCPVTRKKVQRHGKIYIAAQPKWAIYKGFERARDLP